MKAVFQPFDPRQEMRRPDFEIFHNKDMHLDSVGLHHHDFYEVYFFLGGKAEYRVEGRLYRLRPGDVLLLSPMELHQVTVQAGRVPYERIVLWISRSYLASLGGGEDSLSRCFDNALSEHTNLLKRSDGVQMQPLFEQLLEERTPRFHRAVRKFYDTYGYPVSRHIRTPLAADAVYLIMKPLEWLFVAVLYLFDAKPEDRIARQYLPKI